MRAYYLTDSCPGAETLQMSQGIFTIRDMYEQLSTVMKMGPMSMSFPYSGDFWSDYA